MGRWKRLPLKISAAKMAKFLIHCLGRKSLSSSRKIFFILRRQSLNAKSRDVSPYIRFLINILTAVIVVGSGISIHFITNPFGGGLIYLDTMKLPIFNLLLSDVLSVMWLIWVMNMVNWSKGVDGQMPGIVAI